MRSVAGQTHLCLCIRGVGSSIGCLARGTFAPGSLMWLEAASRPTMTRHLALSCGGSCGALHANAAVARGVRVATTLGAIRPFAFEPREATA